MSVGITAYLALILFVPFAAVVYVLLRPTLATAVVLLTAILFLPDLVAFDPPGLPPFDKFTIPGLLAFAGCLMTAGPKLRSSRPGRGVDLFAVVLLVGVFITCRLNPETLTYGDTVLPGLGIHDGISDVVRTLLYAVIPFFLGRVLFRNSRDASDLMGAFVVGALLYVPLILVELRMSPQFHRWVYGFHQHEFGQTMREGGYRPMVFMPHGIALAMFLLTASLAAFALSRARLRLPYGLPASGMGFVLLVVLIACKSIGALVYGLIAVPLVAFGSARVMARVSRWLAIFVLLYPVLRITETFPTQAVLDTAARFSQERADSLAFRFYNEESLVEKALLRRWFGWGGFGRGRIYNSWGKDESTTDGHWIIIFGSNGIVGMVGTYGLLLFPCLLALRRLRKIHDPHERLLVGSLSIVTIVNVVDLLPNGMYTGLPLVLAGALDGVSGGLSRARRIVESQR